MPNNQPLSLKENLRFKIALMNMKKALQMQLDIMPDEHQNKQTQNDEDDRLEYIPTGE